MRTDQGCDGGSGGEGRGDRGSPAAEEQERLVNVFGDEHHVERAAHRRDELKGGGGELRVVQHPLPAVALGARGQLAQRKAKRLRHRLLHEAAVGRQLAMHRARALGGPPPPPQRPRRLRARHAGRWEVREVVRAARRSRAQGDRGRSREPACASSVALSSLSACEAPGSAVPLRSAMALRSASCLRVTWRGRSRRDRGGDRRRREATSGRRPMPRGGGELAPP